MEFVIFLEWDTKYWSHSLPSLVIILQPNLPLPTFASILFLLQEVPATGSHWFTTKHQESF